MDVHESTSTPTNNNSINLFQWTEWQNMWNFVGFSYLANIQNDLKGTHNVLEVNIVASIWNVITAICFEMERLTSAKLDAEYSAQKPQTKDITI